MEGGPGTGSNYCLCRLLNALGPPFCAAQVAGESGAEPPELPRAPDWVESTEVCQEMQEAGEYGVSDRHRAHGTPVSWLAPALAAPGRASPFLYPLMDSIARPRAAGHGHASMLACVLSNAHRTARQ